MPNKITTITPKQSARFGEFVDQWIAIGLSTEPADFDAATDAALRAYKLCNLKRPQVILRMGSPYAATVGGVIAWAMLRELGQQVRSQVRSQVWSQVWSQVGSQVRSQVRSQVESQVESQVRSQVWSQVRSQVWSQVRSQVWSQVWSQVRSQVGNAIYNYRGGEFWASWCAYVAFLRDALDWCDPVLERHAIDESLARSCGWVWWHENVLAISDRPSEIHRDSDGRLHNESGPAILYRDGWALWSLSGIAVDEQIVTQPQSQTVKQIRAETNEEIKRIRIERFGWDRYLKQTKASVIDTRRNDIEGTHEALMRTSDNMVVLVCACPSTGRTYGLEVDPKVSNCEQAQSYLWSGSSLLESRRTRIIGRT